MFPLAAAWALAAQRKGLLNICGIDLLVKENENSDLGHSYKEGKS